MKKIQLKEGELLHLMEVAGTERGITLGFGPSGTFIIDKTEDWIIKEIATLRGIPYDENTPVK